MAAPVDPSYPLYPIACILSAVMLLFVLLTSFIRQSWNLGVAFLCFWLFLENLTNGVSAIVWADNADIKLYVYCDIVTHLQLVSFVVKPMATLIITRRLYLVARLQSVELSDKAARYRNNVIEWSLGLVVPLIVAGPLYYVVQQLRFQVEEGFGCTTSSDGSVLDILLTDLWTVIPPLISITFYYPRVARLLYRQSRSSVQSVWSDDSTMHLNYIRVLALASIDVILTLPIGIVSVVLFVTTTLSQTSMPFYSGWTYVHTDWQPESYSYAEIVASEGTSGIVMLYFSEWTSPVLAFAIFALFGVSSEARMSYWRVIHTVCSWFGWSPVLRARKRGSTLGDIEFGERPQDMSCDSKIGSQSRRTQQIGVGCLSEDEFAVTDCKTCSDRQVKTTETVI